MENEPLIKTLIELIKPLVTDLNYEFYHLEFVEEDNENYLRVYIDNKDGIGLKDCEIVSRKISSMLDEEDPIEVGYYLEVSSPGVFRTLFTDEHLSKHLSSNIAIKLKQLFLGHRKLLGTLVDFDKENIFIKSGEEEITIPRKIIDAITLEGDL